MRVVGFMWVSVQWVKSEELDWRGTCLVCRLALAIIPAVVRRGSQSPLRQSRDMSEMFLVPMFSRHVFKLKKLVASLTLI